MGRLIRFALIAASIWGVWSAINSIDLDPTNSFERAQIAALEAEGL